MMEEDLLSLDGSHNCMYAQVLLPLPLDFIPWYRSEGPLDRGDRVSVRFGARTLDGVVWNVSDCPDIDRSKVLPIKQSAMGLPPVTPEELELWKFISDYYLCPAGDVFRAAYPKLKVRSEQAAASARVRSELSEKKLRESLEARIRRIEERIDKKKAELEGRRDGTKLKAALEQSLQKAEKELESARKALDGMPMPASADCQSETVATSGSSTSAGASLPGKPVLLEAGNRLPYYIKETDKTLAQGWNVLILVPESGLGESIRDGLEKEFGGRIIRFDSGMSPAARRKAADALRQGSLGNAVSGKVIIGTRTALFLPFHRLGLIIVDEEQDTSFKQTEPAPRYNARDCAVILGRIHGAGVILGSASPSLESIYNCLTGKYSRITLPDRTCSIGTVDIPAERRKRGMDGLFSYKLIETIRKHRGPVAIIRGWEKKEDIEEQTGKLFPEREITILSPTEARRGLREGTMCAILQADAFFTRDNFRADEHCLQTLSQIASRCRSMTIQTARSEHPVFALLAAAFSGSDSREAECRMLEERKAFGLPPFSRMLDIHAASPEEAEDIRESLENCMMTAPDTLRTTLARDSSLLTRKAEIAGIVRGKRAYMDVDPL